MTDNMESKLRKSGALSERRAALSPRQLEALRRRVNGDLNRQHRSNLIDRGTNTVAPMSLAQQGMWVLWQMDRASTAYHVGGGLQLTGALNVNALRYAINTLIERHEILRTTFAERVDGTLEQTIVDAVTAEIAMFDFSNTDAAAGDCSYKMAIEQLCTRPFDLERGSLLRIGLLKISENQHQLALLMHHIVSDAWSVDILLKDLARFYDDACAGRMDVQSRHSSTEIRYLDFAQWQQRWLNGSDGKRQLAYWCDRLGTTHPVLELPFDRVGDSDKKSGSAVHDLELPVALVDAARNQARQCSATLFMVLAAAAHALLFRYTGESDMRIGVPAANRNRPEFANVVGCFINTIVLNTRIDDGLRLADLVLQMRDAAIGAQENQEIPLERIIEALRPPRLANGSSLFQVLFNHLQRNDDLSAQWRDLRVEAIDFGKREQPFDLTIEVIEYDSRRVHVQFGYDAGLFEAQTIERMAHHYENVLRAIAEQPQVTVGDIELLTSAEYAQLRRWSENETRHSQALPVHRLFEQQAATQPQATALVFGDVSVSYEQLNQRANQLARQLIERGIGIEVRVGIAMQRSVDLIVALLAVLKTGAAYVPLDPDYPAERLAYMIDDSNIALLLTQQALLAPLLIPSSLPTLALETLLISQEVIGNPAIDTHHNNLAYVIYTSGSTGKPKAVGVAHGVFAEHMQVTREFFALTRNDCVLQFATINFDASLEQLFAPLITGASIVLRGDEVWDSTTFHREMLQKRITVVDLSTSYATLLVQEFAQRGVRDYGDLRRWHVGGEALSSQFPALWRAAGLEQVTLLNTYGPTEAAVTSTVSELRPSHDIDAASAPVPIGKPLPGRCVYVLDHHLAPVPVGVAGELYIGGDLLARGYLGKAALTAERFIADPFAENGGRLYRTGDRVRWHADGELEYLGRIDQQIKIRGFRVEPGEIEAQLLLQENVREAVVVVQGEAASARLLAYVSAQDAAQIDGAQLRRELAQTLPDYMVPSAIVVLEKLPLSPNGKIERKALPIPTTGNTDTYEAPQGDIEVSLAQLWAELFATDNIGRRDHFFELGGHSLLAVRLVSRINNHWQTGLGIRDIFQHPQLMDMAVLLQRHTGNGAAAQALSAIDSFIDELEAV